MKQLTDNHIQELRRYLERAGTSPLLLPELLDHLVCEAEERLWEGSTFGEIREDLSRLAAPTVLSGLARERKLLLEAEATLTDLVFENRNRQYGAYVLRRDYRSTMQRATLLGVGLFLLICLLPGLVLHFQSTPAPGPTVQEMLREVSGTSHRFPRVP
jgi:periplasmic protein TonB